MPNISVLIPCHNAETWLEPAARSICLQSFQDLEILIYNDGSTDASGEIIARLAREDHRIRPMGGDANQGITHGLNSMLDVAQGDYIARMDADDLSLPDRLAKQLRFLQDGHADLCGSWFEEFGSGISRAVRWFSSTEALRTALLFQNTLCHPTVMARRQVFEDFHYRKEYELAEDYDLFARASARYKLANVPQVLLRYRRHPQQATRARRDRMEAITRQIRIEALNAQGIETSIDEQRVHNLIRAPHSIRSEADLMAVEKWLEKLLSIFQHTDAKKVVASQWTRAAVRAAPLGFNMWRRYRQSPLHELLERSPLGDIDLAIMAALKLDYGSSTFEALRRFGLTA